MTRKTVVGYRGVRLGEGDRVEVRYTPSGESDFIGETGVIMGLRHKDGKALIEFDNQVRGIYFWPIDFSWLGKPLIDEKGVSQPVG